MLKTFIKQFKEKFKFNQMEKVKQQGLGIIPEEILCHIASFLPFQDVIRLSNTCQQMKRILPCFKECKGPNVDERGPNDGDWTPEWYFDMPRLTSSVQKLIISMTWKDQVYQCVFM